MLINKQFQNLLFCVLCIVGVSDCYGQSNLPTSSTVKIISLPQSPLYVIATGITAGDSWKNELVVLDATTWQEVNRTELLRTNIWHASLDPKGRVWIGYAGSIDFTTKQVDIFNPDGRLVKTLEACDMPNSGVQFVAGRAFVACLQNGFYGRVAVIDLDSLAVIKTIDLKAEPRFSLLASAASTNTVVLLGDSDTHATLSFINPYSLEIETSLPIYGSANISSIIAHENQFYLLNSASFRDPDRPMDLRVINPGKPPSIIEYNLAVRSPLWGVIKDNKLDVYHNPTFTTTSDDPVRFLSEFDLTTHQSKNWSLPDHWNAGDIAWVNGQIILTRKQANDTNKISGLYKFDREKGQLTQLLYLPGAQLILSPNP